MSNEKKNGARKNKPVIVKMIRIGTFEEAVKPEGVRRCTNPQWGVEKVPET
jgi:hypothetical protein